MVTETMTVSEAVAQGYSQCLQDGRSFVEDIEDVDPLDLEEDTYWIVEIEPTTYQIKPSFLKDRVYDEASEQEEMDDDDNALGAIVKAIPDEEFATLTKLINDQLAKRRWWPTTNIRLVP